MVNIGKTIDYITIPAILINDKKEIIYSNNSFKELFNVEDDEFINNKHINDNYFKENIENSDILDYINDNLEDSNDKYITFKNDKLNKRIEINIIPIKNDDIIYMVLFENISKITDTLYLYEQIFDNTNMGIIILLQNTSNEFIIKDINPTACDMFNSDRLKIINTNYTNYIHSDVKLYDIILKINEDGVKRDIKKIQCDDKWFNINLIKVETGEIILIIDDITKQIKILEKLEKSDKYKTEFLSNMSHEIRSPINSIIGFSELLKDVKNDESKVNKYIEIIQNSSESLIKIVNDILDFSKIEEGKLEINKTNFDINKILENLYLINKNKNKNKNIELKINIPKNTNNILNDSFRLEQIINNLVNNSMKFTKSGYIEIGYKKQEFDILFYVKDTGVGISDDDQSKIFNRYIQAKQSNLESKIIGHGLGLSISKELVKLMGGEIWVKSELDKGSTFFFTLPNHKRINNIKIPNKKIVSYDTDFTDKTILIVEDIDFNIKLLESYLEDTNATLIIATDGNDALLKYNDYKNKLSLILMDIQLPEMNGNDVTKIIRTIDKDTPIIAQTAYAMKGDYENLMSYGFNDIINKPIKKDDLLKIVSKYIDFKK